MTSTPTRTVDNVVIATKGLQDRNTNVIAGTTVENKGKLILTLLVLQKSFITLVLNLYDTLILISTDDCDLV